MKLTRVTRLSTTSKMKTSGFYPLAKKGCYRSALLLLNELNLKLDCLNTDNRFICWVQRPAGNAIPAAMAHMMRKPGSVLVNDVFLMTEKTGTELPMRIMYNPVFAGDPVPGNYIIIDDVISSGATLMGLKNFLESNGCNVVNAIVIGSNRYGPFLEPDKLLLRLLTARFSDIENFLDLKSLTAIQINYLLSLDSLESFYEKYYSASHSFTF